MYSSSKRKCAPIVDFWRIGFDCIVAHDFAHEVVSVHVNEVGDISSLDMSLEHFYLPR